MPSIAKWVRLDSPGGPDLCDVVAPGTITDLTPEIVGSNEIWFYWTGPGDDAALAPSGAPKEFALRGQIGPIQSEEAWAQAYYHGEDLSVPGLAGSSGTGVMRGLQACSWNHFAVRARDDKPQWSAFHPDVLIQTTCNGGGGGFSAHEAPGEEGGATPSSATAPASATGVEPTLGTLIVGTRRIAEGAWQVSLRLATEADGLDPAASGIAVEQENENGERDTLGRVTPDETQNLLGLCSLRERGRVAIPGVYRLEQVMARFRNRAQDHELADAQHSRLGALGAEFLASGGSPELLAGDVLDLTYAPATDAQPDAPSWYLLMRRQGSAPPISFSQRPNLGERLPERFALHQNEPNPAGNSTIIRFDLPVESPVKLEVFDLLGRRVATLANASFPAGTHATAWDLRDDNGAPVRPGVYVCRLVAGDFRAQRKMGALP